MKISIIAVAICFVAAASSNPSLSTFVSRADARKRLLLQDPLHIHAPIPCPCMNKTLCQPLATPLPDKESFAFQVTATNWPFYDWDRLTSIVLYDGLDPSMLCMAHANGVRVIWAATFSASQLLNTTAKEEFLTHSVANVVNSYADGVNFDFEGLVEELSAEFDALTELTQNLVQRTKAAVPTASVTFDVAWSANHVDVRYYNYSAIAAACDFIVLMDYDTRSQVFSGPPCVAGPNSPMYTAETGIASYLDLDIPPYKLVLGEPWYGYVYPCQQPADIVVEVCQIASVPFRGVPCSDAAGHQWNYGYIHDYLENQPEGQRFTPITVNTTASYVTTTINASLIFPSNTYNGLNVAAMFFDNAETLAQKFAVAKAWGLRGVSMWNMDSVDYQNPAASQVTKGIWKSLDAFLAP